jgi:hypothetical protein
MFKGSHALRFGSLVLVLEVASPAWAARREYTRDFPVGSCPAHSGHSVIEVDPDFDRRGEPDTNSAVRIRPELEFVAEGPRVTVELFACDELALFDPAQQGPISITLDRFAVVERGLYESSQDLLHDRRTSGGDSCYQQDDQNGFAKTVGSVFGAAARATCGPGNPQCPFRDDFGEPSASWQLNGAKLEDGELVLAELPPTVEAATPICRTARLVLGNLVPRQHYVIDFDMKVGGGGFSGRGQKLVDISIFTEPLVDFTGNPQPDLLWHHQGTGQLFGWDVDGAAYVGGFVPLPASVPPQQWEVAALGDLDGDGDTDVVWRNRTSALLIAVLMEGTVAVDVSVFNLPFVPDLEWAISGLADFDGDTRRDLLLVHKTFGYVAIAFLVENDDGKFTRFESEAAIVGRLSSLDWKVRGVVDLNHDGRPDLLLHNEATGALSALFLKVNQTIGTQALEPAAVSGTWRIAAVRDFDRDGEPDLLWQHRTTGALAVFFMDGTNAVSIVPFAPAAVPDLSWWIVPR